MPTTLQQLAPTDFQTFLRPCNLIIPKVIPTANAESPLKDLSQGKHCCYFRVCRHEQVILP